MGIHGNYIPILNNVIKDWLIDWGTGTDQVNADDIPIIDAAAYFTATTIESALAEIYLELYNRGLWDLTLAEVQQLQHIGDNLISYVEWGYVATMQAVDFNATPQFKGILAQNGNVTIKSTTGEPTYGIDFKNNSDVTRSFINADANGLKISSDVQLPYNRELIILNQGSLTTQTGINWKGGDGTPVSTNDIKIQRDTESLIMLYDTTEKFNLDMSANTLTLFDTATITETKAGYIDAMDQGISTTDSPTFNGLTLNNELEMSNNPIDNVDYIDFNKSATVTNETGRMYWNASDDTLNIGMEGSSVILQVGQEILSKCRNISGVTIFNGQVVYVSGANSNRPKITLANASNITTSQCVIGIATEDIANTTNGYVNTFGIVRDINTSGWAEGDILWLSTTDGQITNVRPTQPNIGVCIGICLHDHATEGMIFVKVEFVPRLQDLSDVYISSISDGDLIRWNNTNQRFEVSSDLTNHLLNTSNPHSVTHSQLSDLSTSGHPASIISTTLTNAVGTNVQDVLETSTTIQHYKKMNGFINKKTDTTITFTDGTRTFEIAPTGASFSFVQNAKMYTKSSSENIVISATEGIHAIYYNGGTLSETTSYNSYTNIVDNILVAYVYWDATNSKHIMFGDERHGLMDSETHYYEHTNEGTRYQSGLGLNNMDVDGSGNDESAAQFGMDSGKITDEDLEHIISALTLPAQIPVFYRDGTTWRRDDPRNYPVKQGTSLLAWNQITGGSGSQVDATNFDFVFAHIFGTNDRDYPIIAFQGQGEYNTLFSARANAETEILSLYTIGMPFAEFTPIATIIYQTGSTYSNGCKARIRSTDDGADYIDWRVSPLRAGGSVSGSTAFASAVITDTTDFAGILSSTDNTVQVALDTIDDLIHADLPDIGTNTHTQIDTHIADSTTHFTEGSIDHTAISNIGTNAHSVIDTHLASTTNPHTVTAAQLSLGTTDNVEFLSITSDIFKSKSRPTESLLDFDDDEGGIANSVSLVAAGDLNMIIDSNNNSTIGEFGLFIDATDGGTATKIFSINETSQLKLWSASGDPYLRLGVGGSIDSPTQEWGMAIDDDSDDDLLFRDITGTYNWMIVDRATHIPYIQAGLYTDRISQYANPTLYFLDFNYDLNTTNAVTLGSATSVEIIVDGNDNSSGGAEFSVYADGYDLGTDNAHKILRVREDGRLDVFSSESTKTDYQMTLNISDADDPQFYSYGGGSFRDIRIMSDLIMKPSSGVVERIDWYDSSDNHEGAIYGYNGNTVFNGLNLVSYGALSSGHIRFWTEYVAQDYCSAKFETDASGNTELLISGVARQNSSDTNEWGKLRYISGASPYFEMISNQGLVTLTSATGEVEIKGTTTGDSNYSYVRFIQSNGTHEGYIGVGSTSDSSIRLQSAIDHVIIDSNNLIYGQAIYDNTSGSSANVYIGTNGALYRSTSSIRYKTDVFDLGKDYNYLEIFEKIRPVEYKSICERDNKEIVRLGLIGEELDKICPALVHHEDPRYENITNGDIINLDTIGRPTGVKYERLTVINTKVLQDTRKELTDLRSRLEKLEKIMLQK